MAVCKEGDWIAVQLEERGWVLGLIARGAKTVPYNFAYFFPPRRETKPTMADTLMLGPPDALMLCICNLNKYEVVGSAEGWNRAQWPMPRFLRRQGTSLVSITRDQNDPGNIVNRENVTEAQAKDMVRDQICDDKDLPLRLEIQLVNFENATAEAMRSEVPAPPSPAAPPPPPPPIPAQGLEPDPAPPAPAAPPPPSTFAMPDPIPVAREVPREVPRAVPPPIPRVQAEVVLEAEPEPAPDRLGFEDPQDESGDQGRYLDPQQAGPPARRAHLDRQTYWVRVTKNQTFVLAGKFRVGRPSFRPMLRLEGAGWTDEQVYEVLRVHAQAAAEGYGEGREALAAEFRQLLKSKRPR